MSGDAPKPEPTRPAPEVITVERIIADGRMTRDDSQIPHARELVREFVTQALDEGMVVSDDVVAAIKTRIAAIDELMSDQLNEILHHPEFQQLEASWRGLSHFVMNSETGTRLKIRLLNVTKKELLTDLEKATEFDQSMLFKKVYEEEYGTFGGHPFSCLIGDYEFGRHPQDMKLLEKISNVAAAAHAPFLAPASPKLFDMDSFTELGVPRDLAKIFETTELVKWRSFRESEDSRYVALVLPHVLLRLPYGADTVPVDGFNFEEDVDGTDHAKYLWGNAAYALGQRITDAFSQHGWTAAIRGVEGGGLVEGLPAHTFRTDERRHRAEVPDRDRDHRSPREGAERSRLHLALPLQGHRLRRVLRRPDDEQAEAVQHQPGQRERAHLGQPAVHAGRLALRALHQGDDARQGRQLHDARERLHVPQQLDRRLRPARRQRAAGRQGEVPAARGARRRRRHPRQARLLPRGRVPAAALPARGADGVDAPGGGAAAACRVRRGRRAACRVRRTGAA